MKIQSAHNDAASRQNERRDKALDEIGRFLAFLRNKDSNESADHAILHQASTLITARRQVNRLQKVWRFNYSDALTVDDRNWVRHKLNTALCGFSFDIARMLNVPESSLEVYEGFERNGEQYRILVDFIQPL